MREHPIIFSASSVRAIFDGTKTQTRRPLKNKNKCPYGVVGDRLWVRETWKATGLFAWCSIESTKACERFVYKADNTQPDRDKHLKWRPSIHMPRWASRIMLEITDIRLEWLRSITPRDAMHEGFQSTNDFCVAWDSVYSKTKFSWDENPAVRVITFRTE